MPYKAWALTAKILGSWIRIPLEADLRRADPPSRESYQMLNQFIISEVVLNGMRNFIICTHSADQVKVNEVGGACGTHGRGEKIVQGFGGKARRKETTQKTKA
jgi:hypothetical protein